VWQGIVALPSGRPQALARLLAVRMALTALALLFMLLASLLAYRFANLPDLRRATLHRMVVAVATNIEQGGDSAHLDLYERYPRAYGFRAFGHRTEDQRRMIAAANLDLLPALDHVSVQADGDLQSWFGRLPARADAAEGRGWTLTARVELEGRQYRVQAVMFGDPAKCWFWVILDNLIHDALVPVGLVTPTLTFAIDLTTRAALRPLSVVADQASGIGGIAGDLTPEPLSATGLPREIGHVVGVINRMLSRLHRSQDQQRHFTADVAHELRTPVAVLLLEVGQLPPGPARQSIAEELLTLSAMTNEMLRFAQARTCSCRSGAPATWRRSCAGRARASPQFNPVSVGTQGWIEPFPCRQAAAARLRGTRRPRREPRRKRVCLYSHDTFGLGHLRRTLAVAEHLLGREPGFDVVLLTGSPVIGTWALPPGLRVVAMTPVVKLAAERYAAREGQLPFSLVKG